MYDGLYDGVNVRACMCEGVCDVVRVKLCLMMSLMACVCKEN